MNVIANIKNILFKNCLYGFIPNVIAITNTAVAILNRVIMIPRLSIKINSDDRPPHNAPIAKRHLCVNDLVIFLTAKSIK